MLCVATDVASSGAYNIVEINEDGQGDTVLPSFDLCSLQGGASPSKESTAFKISAPTNIRVRITNANFGNNSVGVDAGSGQTVACLDYRGPSVDTMFTGAGTILRREFGSTSITTS